MTAHAFCPTPIGDLLLVAEEGALTMLHLPGRHTPAPPGAHDPEALARPIAQLTEYFAGERQTFDLELAPHGTPFEQEVWARLADIPYGHTTTYAAMAAELGRPRATRAVGRANGRNPLAIVLPCHRVVGSDGKLTGYAGGLEMKAALLDLERTVAWSGVPSGA